MAGWLETDTQLIYKLQLALKQKGVIVLINTIQLYSEEQKKYIKVYKVTHNKKEILRTSSKIKVIKALNILWQEVKDND